MSHQTLRYQGDGSRWQIGRDPSGETESQGILQEERERDGEEIVTAYPEGEKERDGEE